MCNQLLNKFSKVKLSPIKIMFPKLPLILTHILNLKKSLKDIAMEIKSPMTFLIVLLTRLMNKEEKLK